MFMRFLDSEIADSGDDRVGLTVGGRYGLVRVHPKGSPERGVQFDAQAAFYGQFDMEHSLDNVGWDGFYGLMLSWKPTGRLALMFGTQHDSSHVGDEYIERKGRTRLTYTREEFAWGASYSSSERWGHGGWRGYAEAGWAYHRGNTQLMERWRLQVGLEYESPLTLAGGLGGWYAAVNNGIWQERGWQSATTVQAGVKFQFADIGRQYRFAVEFRNGRSVIGEFFQQDERYISFGMWLDL
jgi:hypothetical protein